MTAELPTPQPSRTSEDLSRRLAAAEQRLALLEAQNEGAAGAKWLVAPAVSAGGSLITTVVTVVGFGLVHRLSLARQRRDEFFKRVQDCTVLVKDAARLGSKIWRQADAEAEGDASRQLLQSDIDALTDRLSLLQKAEPGLKVTTELVEFRTAALLDIESPQRLADMARADRVLRLGQTLATRLQQRYAEVFDGSRRSRI